MNVRRGDSPLSRVCVTFLAFSQGSSSSSSSRTTLLSSWSLLSADEMGQFIRYDDVISCASFNFAVLL